VYDCSSTHCQPHPWPLSPSRRRAVADRASSAVSDTRFAHARQFGAWLGLVPSQNSTGGKASLGRITRRGDDYLRTLLIQGAKSAVMTAGKRSDRISQWLVQLQQRAGWQKAVVALANKNARILWAVLTRDAAFDPNHVPEAPAARSGPKLQAKLQAQLQTAV
jgi:transposase